MITSSLARSFGQIGVLTAASRILGLLRDIVFAAFLGAGPAADAFLVALKLPNMFRRLSAEGALSNAFVPSFAREARENGGASALRLASEVQAVLLFVLLAVVVVFEIMMPSIVMLLAPGFSTTPERFAAAVALARITMPYLPMISLVAFWAAIANAHDRFVPGAAMPILFNVCMIGGALVIPLLSGELGVQKAKPVAFGLLGAGALQMAAMYVVLHRMGKVPHFSFSLKTSATARRMWRKFLPAALGAFGMQLNLIVDLILASLLPVGAISWLYYADRIVQLPLGIVGIALGTALLPRFSQAEAAGDNEAVKTALGGAITLGGFLVVPAVTGLIILAEPILTGLFAHGAFTRNDAGMAGLALVAYAIGLPGFVLVKILQPAFYAAGRPGTVLKISAVMVITNIAGSLLLMGPFGHMGLAIATAISGLLAAVIMMLLLAAAGKISRAMLSPVFRILLASGVMAVLLWFLRPVVADLASVVRLLILVVAGGGTYFAAAALFGAVPVDLLRRR